MVSPLFFCHCADDNFDFRHILAYPGLIGRKGVNLSKVSQVIPLDVTLVYPDYCAEHDHYTGMFLG